MRALLSSLFSASPRRKGGETLLDAITAQARQPVFFEAYGVPDTLDGRFDVMTLHAWMVFRALRARGKAAGQLAQTTADLMFTAFDDAIRSLGVGDSGIPRRVKAMTRAYVGRSETYAKAFESDDAAAMADGLRRNIFRGAEPARAIVTALTDYVFCETRRLSVLDVERFQRGELGFAPIPQPASS